MNRKLLLPYCLLVVAFAFALAYALHFGTQQFAPSSSALQITNTTQSTPHNSAPAPVLVQILCILCAAKFLGDLFGHFKQPRVMGEILAGIALGPSLFGRYFPELSLNLFAPHSLKTLKLLSEVGLILFLFAVGTEVKLEHFKKKFIEALWISHMSVFFPFILGTLTALLIYSSYSPAHVSFSNFALFMGIAMSITAFPVLARILDERGLSSTPIGIMALGCAAIDDLTAWCALAVVIGLARSGTSTEAIRMLGGTALYITLMFVAIRPVLRTFFARGAKPNEWSHQKFSWILLFVLSSAALTEWIGIHALFGAFFAGALLPAPEMIKAELRHRIQGLTSVLLLPIFFALTGLNTKVSLISNAHDVLMCLLLIAVAIVGKGLGCVMAARWTDMSWRDSLTLGTLMNTRGLMELVVLNIGLELGIISQQIFAMMVLMAIITTLMAGPLLNLLLHPTPKLEFVNEALPENA